MRITLSILFLLLFSAAFGQEGYRFDFAIKGWKDTTTYLGFYYGESAYLKDTAKVNSKGEFYFDNKKALPQGIYFLVLKNVPILDFVVGKDQHFKLETTADDPIHNMKVTGDEDNKLFFDNQVFLQARHEEADPYIKIVQDSTLKKDDPAKKEARDAFSKVNDKVMAHQDDIIARYPTLLTARIMKSSKPLVIPDPPKKADGSIDSTFQLRYYRAHYFDNFDLGDEAMLRMPKGVYQQKVKEYLEKLFLPQPDTITKAINGLAVQAKKNQETYQYFISTCAFLYQAPEIMGLDQVFVNIYNKYFATGEMDYWANAQLKKNYKDLADKISRAQIGTIAPNLMMQDQDLKPRTLYDIKNKYTIIYFFDPECGHCRQESPKLVNFYNNNKTKFDFEVYAVSNDTSMKKLRDYIKEMKMTWITVDGPRSYLKEHFTKLYFTETYPSIYILDDKKKIIARKLAVDKLSEFLTNYERFKKLKPQPVGAKGS